MSTYLLVSVLISGIAPRASAYDGSTTILEVSITVACRVRLSVRLSVRQFQIIPTTSW